MTIAASTVTIATATTTGRPLVKPFKIAEVGCVYGQDAVHDTEPAVSE